MTHSHNIRGALQLLCWKIYPKCIAEAPEPHQANFTNFLLGRTLTTLILPTPLQYKWPLLQKGQKSWPALTNLGAPYNFCFIKFLTLIKCFYTPFRGLIPRGLWYQVKTHPRNFPPWGPPSYQISLQSNQQFGFLWTTYTHSIKHALYILDYLYLWVSIFFAFKFFW